MAQTVPQRNRATGGWQPPAIIEQSGDDLQYSSVLIYGKDGVGKTTTAAAAGNYARTLVINAEDGTRRICGSVMTVSSVRDVDYAVQEAISGRWQAIAVDTLDRLYKMALVAARAGEINPLIGPPIFKNQSGEVQDNRLNDPRAIHGIALDWLIGHVQTLHRAPILALFTAHAREVIDKDKQGNVLKTTLRLDLPPRFGQMVRDSLDVVLYAFRTPDGGRKMYADMTVVGQSVFYAKDRHGVFCDAQGKYAALPLSYDLIADRLGLTRERITLEDAGEREEEGDTQRRAA